MSTKLDTDTVVDVLTLDLFKSLEGKSFCMTGTMSVTRSQLEGIISYLDGTNHSAVKTTTFALIVPNDTDFRKGSKYRTALKNGTMILSEQEFCNMILPSLDELRGTNNVGAGKD